MKTVLALAVLTASFLAALAVGDRAIPPSQILPALLARPGSAPDAVFILRELRLPRALMAMIVGAGLAAAGAICQAAMRNPLGDPGLIGINGGAAFAVMVLLVVLPGVPMTWVPLAAFTGALVMVLVIQGLALQVGLRSQRIILIGIGCSAMIGAMASFLSVFGDVIAVQRAMVWTAGSLQDSRWEKLASLALWLTVPLILTLLVSPALDLLGFEDAVARGLGLRAGRARAGMLTLCALVAGGAVAATGPVGFIGLVAPHIARRLSGTRHAQMLPVSMLVGATLLLIADTAGRSLIAPAQIPAGVMAALFGAPFFGWLLWRRRND